VALGLKARLEQSRKRFTVAHWRIARFDFRMKIAALRLRLDTGSQSLETCAERLLQKKRERLERLSLQLQERGPLKALERGYAIATDAAGNVLRSTEQVAIGDAVAVRLQRGRLTAEVRKKD